MNFARRSAPFVAAVAFAHSVWVDPADAAARAKYGGTLRIALTGPEAFPDPSLADAPSDAAMFRMSFEALCRWQSGDRLQPVLAAEMAQAGPRSWRITLVDGVPIRGSAGALTAHHVAQSWTRLSQQATLSPYRALLYPLRGEGRQLEGSVFSSSLLELSTSFAWPDLPASLCHPALAVTLPTQASGVPTGVGPFLATSRDELLEQNPSFPLGRPYVERLKVASVAFARSAAWTARVGMAGGSLAEPLTQSPD